MVVGSIPTIGSRKARVAQLVEHRFRKAGVVGSIPTSGSKIYKQRCFLTCFLNIFSYHITSGDVWTLRLIEVFTRLTRFWKAKPPGPISSRRWVSSLSALKVPLFRVLSPKHHQFLFFSKQVFKAGLSSVFFFNLPYKLYKLYEPYRLVLWQPKKKFKRK